MVGETKRRSNTEKKDVAFFEGSDFHHVQAHLHLDNFIEYNVVTKKGRAWFRSNVVFRKVNNTPFYANL